MQRCQNDVVINGPSTNDHVSLRSCHHGDLCDVCTLYYHYHIPYRWRQHKITIHEHQHSIDRTRGLIDNPDQRISEDVAEFTRISIELCFDFVSSMIELCSFSVILYSVSIHSYYTLHSCTRLGPR